MNNLKTLSVFAILLVISACTNETSEKPISGNVDIEMISAGMTKLKYKIYIDVDNPDRIVSCGLRIYDSDMSYIETKKSQVIHSNGTTIDSIVGLERGKDYQVQFFITDYLSNEIRSQNTPISMNSFEVTGVYHKNVLEHDLDEGWGEWNGVLSGDSIFITGKYLNEYDNSCEIFLENLSDVVDIIKNNDNELIVYLDSTINHKLDFNDFYKECSIYILENSDTVENIVTINIFPDKPFLERCDVQSGGWIEMFGGMGNNGLDSLCVNNIKCNSGGWRTYASRYYHQRWAEYYSIEPALNSGTYTFIGYLNGYSDSLLVQVP